MDSVIAWNVRGFNNLDKQSEVKIFLQTQNVKLVGLLETKIKAAALGALYLNLCPNWCITTNLAFHKSGRIIVIWQPLAYTLSIEYVTDQLVHCKVSPAGGFTHFWCTFVYGHNDKKSRESLWRDIVCIKDSVDGSWVLLRDFNTVMSKDERVGSIVRISEITPFRECVQQCGLEDMKFHGRFFTWNNKQSGESRVMSKLDRVLINDEWQVHFGNAEAVFLP